jgi:AAHS family 4-hydroxybenzoate transporter-like MFS transporter
LDRRFGPFRWSAFILCFLAVALDGFDTAAISYVAPALVGEWGVKKEALGAVLSAALFGLAVGALVAGPLSDRLGRKTVLVGSVLFFGFASLASAMAEGLESITYLRFITGVGLGAAMPNAATLMSEYAPVRRRSVLTNAMFCGFPLGASLGGILASWIIPQFGWRALIAFGGLAPLLLSLAMTWRLPESERFLLANERRTNRGGKFGRTTAASLASLATKSSSAPHTQSLGAIKQIVSQPLVLGTTLLWSTYFIGLTLIYLLASWMPILMTGVGFDVGHAALISSLFGLGGAIGAPFAGWLMDRWEPHWVLVIGFALAAGLMPPLANSFDDLALFAILLFLSGTALNGAQTSLPSLAARYYPLRCRATGVAWMMGIGRAGAITGALLGAKLLQAQLGLREICILLPIPAVVAASALITKHYLCPSDGKTDPYL